jgi:DNA-binding response OmpR family regulator
MRDGKARILLVDDEQAVIKMVGKRLETAGFDVVSALDGEAALERARAECPDLIVLDLMLPKLSGLKVCATLKREEPFRRIPVIIFTGKDQEVDQSVCADSGADSYVPKSLSVNVLLTEIKTLLAKRLAS